MHLTKRRDSSRSKALRSKCAIVALTQIKELLSEGHPLGNLSPSPEIQDSHFDTWPLRESIVTQKQGRLEICFWTAHKKTGEQVPGSQV
jgi:hypothetical protein